MGFCDALVLRGPSCTQETNLCSNEKYPPQKIEENAHSHIV